MSAICQRSPCSRLTNVIGLWVRADKTGWFMRVALPNGQDDEQRIDYCPFCGTHLTEIQERVVEKLPPRPKKPHLRAVPMAAETTSAPALHVAKPLAPPPPPPPGLRPDATRWKRK